jgi:hypothetical protein
VLKFAKPILVVTGILLLAYALAVLGLNIYLQSSGLQSRIHEAAFSAAGTPLTIQGSHYTPWSGFTVSGITIPQPQGKTPAFEAASVSFRLAFLPLLQGRLVIKEVNIKAPVLISRNLPEKKSERAAEAPTATPVSQPTVVVEKPVGAVEISSLQEPSSRPPTVEIRRINVRDGRSEYYDSKGRLILAVEKVSITTDVLPGGRFAGKFEIGEASAGASVHPRRITGTFTCQDGRLVIPDIRGKLSGGVLTGSFELDPRSGFSATAALEGVLLKKLAEEAGISADGAKGSLFAMGSLRGMPGDPGSITGAAEIDLQEARFQPVNIIRQIGDLMNIRELQMLELKTAAARISIRDQQANIESLVLESENLVMDGTGPVGFDGKLKIRARLDLNEKLRKDLSGLLGDNFQDSEREGYRQIPFSVTGKLSRPKTDLLDKLTGFRIGQDLGGLLNNLFRAPAKEKKNPEKEAN